jgi:hypothetical protein
VSYSAVLRAFRAAVMTAEYSRKPRGKPGANDTYWDQDRCRCRRSPQHRGEARVSGFASSLAVPVTARRGY